MDLGYMARFSESIWRNFAALPGFRLPPRDPPPPFAYSRQGGFILVFKFNIRYYIHLFKFNIRYYIHLFKFNIRYYIHLFKFNIRYYIHLFKFYKPLNTIQIYTYSNLKSLWILLLIKIFKIIKKND